MHEKFSFTGSGELRVRSGGLTLLAAGELIVIGDRIFRLAEVDRVAYHAAARLDRASYSLGVGQGCTRCRFVFDAYRRGTELEDARETWRRLVELLESTACPRIARAAADAISAGSTVRFGGGASPRIDADADGLRRFGRLGKKVPWARVGGTDLREGQVRVWTASAGRPGMAIGMSGWNAVVLPRVVRIMLERKMNHR